ncbi:MAG: SWIM zinc finger domain-containing protein [Armatimonadetes bacterium]|nr:SWIM zinc finger domain-containing protein [Armatimonadota bacterium]
MSNRLPSVMEADGDQLPPQVALAQQIRLATARKALEAVQMKYRRPLEVAHVGGGFFEVTSEKGVAVYHVYLRRNRETCDCPHFQHRLKETGQRCKHIMAAVGANRARTLKAARDKSPEELRDALSPEKLALYRPEMEEALRQALSEWHDAEPGVDPLWATRKQVKIHNGTPVTAYHR